jgi:hypothetical protein
MRCVKFPQKYKSEGLRSGYIGSCASKPVFLQTYNYVNVFPCCIVGNFLLMSVQVF